MPIWIMMMLFQVGKEVEFTLLKRPRHSIIPMQVFADGPSEENVHTDAETSNAWDSRPAGPQKRSGAEGMRNGKAAGGHVTSDMEGNLQAS